jgi:enamine deaminase RidA (YjgF/YER057c/UK114 family)
LWGRRNIGKALSGKIGQGTQKPKQRVVCHTRRGGQHMSLSGFLHSFAVGHATRITRCFPAAVSSSVIPRERSVGGFFSSQVLVHRAALSSSPTRGNNSSPSPTAMNQHNKTDDDRDIVRGPSPGPGRAAFVIFNNVVSTVGWPTGFKDFVGQDNDTVTTQTILALRCLDQRLRAAGTNRRRILEVTVFLASVAEDKDAMDQVWQNWCPEGCGVSRVVVGAELAQGVRVFFKVTAAMPEVHVDTSDDRSMTASDHAAFYVNSLI